MLLRFYKKHPALRCLIISDTYYNLPRSDLKLSLYACFKWPATVLFLASVAAQIGSQTDPPYSAAKAAVINYTRVLAMDHGKDGIRANAICPGFIETGPSAEIAPR